MTDTPFMRPAEVARFLDVSQATLRLWRARGDEGPPSFLLGGRVRYVRDEVLAWVAAQQRGTRGATRTLAPPEAKRAAR